jgi:hypothetical protein
MKIILLFFLISSSLLGRLCAQDSSITELSGKHIQTFEFREKKFSGDGWEQILSEAAKTNYIAVGEDHFTNEIPAFCSAMIDHVKVDNFFCETDPFSAKILESKIKELSATQLEQFVAEYGNTFSFFALQPELDLFKKAVAHRARVFGTDQILLVADRLLCADLKTKTTNEAAARIYGVMEEQSKSFFDSFRDDPKKPFYMLTPEFEKKIEALSALKLSAYESKIIEKLTLTARIYKEQNHHLRIQLMKDQLMEQYDHWATRKSLFKYGAVHMAKGESLLDIYDLGNLINNIADSKFQNSLHIMIIGKAGAQGSPFQKFPPTPIDQQSADLKALKPFFKVDHGKSWQCFDLAAIRGDIKKQKIRVENPRLVQILAGYDFLVIIPEVTPAKFAF